jgi:hypothetical protein
MTAFSVKYKKKLWVAPDSSRIPWNRTEKVLLTLVVFCGAASLGLALYLFWPREAEALRDFAYARVQVIVPEELKARFPLLMKKLARETGAKNCLLEISDVLYLKTPAPDQTLLVQRMPHPPGLEQVAEILQVSPSRVVEKELEDNFTGVLFSIYLGRDAEAVLAN